MREMLGSADQPRDHLFEHLVRGDIAKAFKEFREQYYTGADPVSGLRLMAEFVDFVTRVDNTSPRPATRRSARPMRTTSR